ncbi:DUF1614 domain-containing protein [Desulfofalx alkaliphila]|uniref:DUF1614 domain-containing protein n=1 Tax=Desulfofalx alkaliphila TaxID=105483 RepID=UPI0004E1082F|nr:DUF1614 domain-containing protein [Desulfofalx alkaliphila]
MTQLPIGLIALIAVSFLIYFGLAQRVLDRMRLSDKAALGVIVALIVGSFITIPLPLGNIRASINVGGALIPIALAIYLLSKAGTTKERVRALIATVATGLVVYFIGSLLMAGLPEPAGRYGVIDSIYLYPIAAAITGYLVGRSRRSAFIAAVLGVVLVDVFHYIWLLQAGAVGGVVAIGGAGAFDVTVLAGILAVLLAEFFGELRERLQGGPATEGRPKELLAALKKPDFNRRAKKTTAIGDMDKKRRGE